MYNIILNRTLPAVSLIATLFLIFFSLFALPVQAADAQSVVGVVYVNHAVVGGDDDGSSWEDAYADLQDAFDDSAAVEIWVATGVYTPGTEISDTFNLPQGVAIYGGFAATEDTRTKRDWEANITVLSGDIGGDDLSDDNKVVTDTANIIGSNSYHVLSGLNLTDTAVLDGFTVTAGKAESPDHLSSNNNGGGLTHYEGGLTLANIIFSGNFAAKNGGGMFNDRSDLVLLTNVTFQGNSAENGGGMYSSASDLVLTDVLITNNVAITNGGGIANLDGVSMLSNVIMSGNSALTGGGMYNADTYITLTNVTVDSNSAIEDGGGLFFRDESSSLTNVTIRGNTAGNDGAGVAIHTDSSEFINVLVSGNVAGADGGGMHNNGGDLSLINVTISGNSANNLGGGVFNAYGSATVVNAIAWNNRAANATGTITATMVSTNNTSVVVSNSIVQASGEGVDWDSDLGLDGGNNIDRDPIFATDIDLSLVPTTLGNFQLQLGSPAINKGNTISYTSPITKDVAGNIRVQDIAIDFGAYESDLICPVHSTLRVDGGVAAPGGDGSDWGSAFKDLRSALLTANSCTAITEVWVAKGGYSPGPVVDINHSFWLVNNVGVYGGFAATETARIQRDWESNITIMSGDLSGANSYHVVTGNMITESAVLDGFTITGGQANGVFPNDRGGGIANISNSSPTLRNLTIVSNEATFGGGMSNSDDSNPILINVVITNNIASSSGGGMFNTASDPTLTNVTIISNVANLGGGLFNTASDPTLTNVAVISNAANLGGGLFNEGGTTTISQGVIQNNVARDSGGGLYAIGLNSAFEIGQSLINENIAQKVRGGGLYIREGATANVINSTISGNYAMGEDGLAADKGNGGGIYVGAVLGSRLTLESVTVTNNDAAGNGGGIDFNRLDAGDVLTISNSIVAGNSDGDAFPDCYDNGTSNYTLNANSNNLFGGTAGDACTAGANDLSLTALGKSISDVLEPLADNSGLTAGATMMPAVVIQTHALIIDGPATNQGNTSKLIDQRGHTRPRGLADDIGAFELPLETLIVQKDGTGSGTISSAPTGTDCGVTCSFDYFPNTTVTLTAVADNSSIFTGWDGEGCSGTGTCLVTVDTTQSVTATFVLKVHPLTTQIIGTGGGSISRSSDAAGYDHGTMVTLTPIPSSISNFTGWSGACTGAGSCVVNMDSAKSVTANFDLKSYALTTETAGNGDGTIAQSPNAAIYVNGTTVTLTATPATSSVFIGWSGACTGTGDCMVLVDAEKTVTATFEKVYTLYLPVVSR